MILYLSYDGMTDPLGQSQVLPYLEGLSRLGFSIHLISFEKPERMEKTGNSITEQCKKANINWHPLIYTKKPPVLSTLYDLFKLSKKGNELNKKYNFQIIHCRSLLTTIVGRNLVKKNGAKLIFDMRGFWVDERVEGNIWNISNPFYLIIYNFLKKKEKQLLIESDAIVSLTHKACPIIHEIQGKEIKNQFLTIIPCCADINFFDPIGISNTLKQKLLTDLKIPEGSFVLSYVGGIGTWYLLDDMLDFYIRLLHKFPFAFFLFITQEDRQMILNIASQKGINTDRIIVQGAPRSEMPALLSLSNASLFFIKPSYSKQASSPTKQGELMSMGIPIVCNKGIGDTDKIIIEGKAGFLCEELNNQAYDKAIEHITQYISQEKQDQIREAAISFYSLDEGIKSYAKLYRSLLYQE